MNNAHTDVRSIEQASFFKQKNFEDKVKFLLRYAILAPSTHNSQPWLFRMSGNTCEIYYDPSIKIVYGDPLKRDLYISMGCLIENLVIAAKYFSIFDSISYVFEDNLVARITFREDNSETTSAEFKHLIDIIPARINVRGKFEEKEIETQQLNEIGQLAAQLHPELTTHMVTDKDKIKKFAELTREGIQIIYKSKEFRREMSSWMRSSMSKKRDGLPGYSLRMSLAQSLIIPKLVKYVDIGNKLSKLNYASIASAPAICVISAKENSPANWVQTGQLAEHLMLEFPSRGVKTSIFIASIEIGELYKSVQEILGTNEIPQFLFAAGYMDSPQPPTPRHLLSTKML